MFKLLHNLTSRACLYMMREQRTTRSHFLNRKFPPDKNTLSENRVSDNSK